MTYFQKMPKADLHFHLDGALRPQTVIDLAKEQRVSLPTNDVKELKNYLSAPEDCVSLVEYLKRFDLPLLVLKTREAQIRVAREAVEDAANENVKYLEVRFAPQLMRNGGLTCNEVTENVIEGLKEGEEKTGTRAQAILCCMRHQDEKTNLEVIETAKKYLGKGVCAVDLAGDEFHFPPELFKNVFKKANDYGIPVTIHAGEAGGAENIKTSVDMLGASRIGHGIRLRENKEIYDYIKEKKIPLEICVTSNIQTKAAPTSFDHPIRDYFDDGLVVTANTDNTTVSDTNMTREFKILSQDYGFTTKELRALTLNSIKSAFLGEDEKEKLIAEINEGYDNL